jgi:hypothetical protein
VAQAAAGSQHNDLIHPAIVAETVLAEAFAVLLPALAVRMTGHPETGATASGAGRIGAMAQGSAIPAVHASQPARVTEATIRGAEPVGRAAGGDGKHALFFKYKVRSTSDRNCYLPVIIGLNCLGNQERQRR